MLYVILSQILVLILLSFSRQSLWTHVRIGNMLKIDESFFVEFADNHNFDPLFPENWYPITQRQLLVQGGNRILLASGGNMAKALQNAFPEMDIVESRFSRSVI